MEISPKKYHIWNWVLKLNSRLSFLPLFTGCKKMLRTSTVYEDFGEIWLYRRNFISGVLESFRDFSMYQVNTTNSTNKVA